MYSYRSEKCIKRILKKQSLEVWDGFNWLKIESDVRLFIHDDKLAGSIKTGNFLTS